VKRVRGKEGKKEIEKQRNRGKGEI